MVSSALGMALGLTEESTLEELKDGIIGVKDRSTTIHTAIDRGGNSDNSYYRINGSNIEVCPALGYWAWTAWEKSHIKIPISGVMNMTYRDRFSASQNSGSRVLTYNIPAGKPGFMFLWEDFISTESSTSCCKVFGCTRLFVTGELYHMQYDAQKIGLYRFNGGETITINRRAGGTRDTLAGVYMCLIY